MQRLWWISEDDALDKVDLGLALDRAFGILQQVQGWREFVQ